VSQRKPEMVDICSGQRQWAWRTEGRNEITIALLAQESSRVGFSNYSCFTERLNCVFSRLYVFGNAFSVGRICQSFFAKAAWLP
jgi:hypothetical protein